MYNIEIDTQATILSATPKIRFQQNLEAIRSLKSHNPDPRKLELFNGWGSCAKVFTSDEKWCVDGREKLKELLSDREYQRASESIVNAHYTSFEVIKAMWDIVEKLGFKGGRIIEPSCGTGFFFSQMPDRIAKTSELFGVELDPIPAQIAQNLYPEAKIYNQGFEDVSFPNGYFDLAIGNVPFGSYAVHDPKYNFLGINIHNYFIAKLSDLVRPGGFVFVITSSGTLDAPTSRKFRQWLGKKLILRTAFRLPAGCFGEVADTQVSPDVLLFQKVDVGMDAEKDQPSTWSECNEFYFSASDWGGDTANATLRDRTAEITVNRGYSYELINRRGDRRYQKYVNDGNDYYKSYIYDGVHHLLGTPAINELYGDGLAVASDGRDLTEAIAKIANELHCTFTDTPTTPPVILVPQQLIETKIGSFCKHEINYYVREESYLNPVSDRTLPEKIEDFWKLRQILTKVIEAQSSPKDLANYQQALSVVYQYFTKKHGKVNSKVNVASLGLDPQYYLVRTLEKSNGELADIFTKRVCRQYKAPKLATNPTDALIHSLNAKGKLDLAFMSEILGNAPIEKIVEFLSGKKSIFFDPSLQEWVLKNEYLSGNVRQKLIEAETNNLADNVEALKAVQPPFMLPDTVDQDIKLACLQALGVDLEALSPEEQHTLLSRKFRIKLGATYVEPELYRKFAIEVLNIDVKIKLIPSPLVVWTVNGKSEDTTEYGTPELDSAEIFSNALNLKMPRVVIRDAEGSVDRVESDLATQAAQTRFKKMQLAFNNWIWQDRDRAVKLCLHYNQHINTTVPKKFDGSYLQLPGSNPDIKLNPWQLNGVARILNNDATFLAWDVGTGKTFAIIASVMECRRLGLAKKPMIVVLNGTEKQFESDWRKLYPLANLLVPEKLDAEGRKLFTSAIKTADFDAVILTHSQFFTLAMGKEYQLSFLEQEKQQLEDFLREFNSKSDRQSQSILRRCLKAVDSRIDKVNGIGKSKNDKKKKSEITATENLESKLNETIKSKRKDDHIDFEGLTDMLVIDEIHQMKNLSVTTKQFGIKGIPTAYSQRATDTYMKILNVLGQIIGQAAKSGKVVGATGTMVCNTMAEIFNWQRMFQQPRLRELGLDHFDPWSAQFAEAITGAEITPAGKYKQNTRFKSFVNLGVLHRMMGEFVDIVTSEDVDGNLNRPDPKFIDVIMPPSEAQLRFLREALRRSEAIKNRMVEPDEDNMLKVTSDLTKAALSMRLLGEDTEHIYSKLHECVLNVFKIWKATTLVNGVQLIFCDFSTPKADRFNVYYYLRSLLIALGIPREQIEFIHNHNGSKRAKLFDRVNAGEVRILMGSTGKLGTGCNVHKGGLWALHHVDAPWRPSDIEQREGRGIRQGNGEFLGNTLSSILVFRYICERLDALRWQTLQWKQEMIGKFMNGRNIESLDDCDQVVYSYAQVKSLATGNPLLIEESNLQAELNSLLAQKQDHENTQLSLRFKIEAYQHRVKTLNKVVDDVEADIKSIDPAKLGLIAPAYFPTSSGELELSGEAAIEELKNRITLVSLKRQTKEVICRYQGFNLCMISMLGNTSITLQGKNTYTQPTKINGKIYNIYQTSSAKDTFYHINDLLRSLPEHLEELKERQRNAAQEALRCEKIMGQKFEFDARILEIQARLKEIGEVMAEEEKVAINTGENEESEDTEEKENSGDWVHLDDKAISEVSVQDDIIQALKERSESPDWLQELHKLVAVYA